jgi:hypothetical protein
MEINVVNKKSIEVSHNRVLCQTFVMTVMDLRSP